MPSKRVKKIVIGHYPSGKPIYKYFYGKTKKAVEKKALDYLMALKNGLPPEPELTTFAAWADKWIVNYKEDLIGDNTMAMYNTCLNMLLPFFGKLPINQIKPIDIQKFFKDKTDLSDSYIKHLAITLNSIFKAAMANGEIVFNPMAGYRPPKGKEPKKKRAYTLEQTHTILDFAKQHPEGLGPYIILNTGLRRGELMGLRREDFDLQDGFLRVRRSITDVNGTAKINDGGKSRAATRAIPLSSQAIDTLAAWPLPADGWLFQSKYGGILAPRQYARYHFGPFKSDMLAAYPELPVLNLHELRHTFLTLLVNAGTDARTVQKVAGHENINTTMAYYVHETDDDIKAHMIFPTAPQVS